MPYISCLNWYNWEYGKALDDGNVGCGVFVELQKSFDNEPPDTGRKIESLWDLRSFEWLF